MDPNIPNPNPSNNMNIPLTNNPNPPSSSSGSAATPPELHQLHNIMINNRRRKSENPNKSPSSSSCGGDPSTCSSSIPPQKKPSTQSPPSSANANESWQETKASIKERTSCLVNSERLSDITFFVGPTDTPIHGHKTILSAGSPYFEKLFFGPMALQGNMHKIVDMEPEVFLAFLKYLYTDEFDESMDAESALLLLKPAKMYIVPHLANKCVDLLIEKMSPENVFIIYNRAILFDEPKLGDVCLRYLDRQIDKVIQTEEFLDIDLNTLSTVLQRDNLRINECSLFKAMLKWSEAECHRRQMELSPSNQRNVLGSSIQLVRFPAMSQKEFATEVVPSNILTKDEVISVFMHLCIPNEQKQYRLELPFIPEKRMYRSKFNYLTRFQDVLSKVIHFTSFCTGDNVYSSSVKFRTDQRVFINGIGVYAISSSISGLKFNATVSLYKPRSVLASDAPPPTPHRVTQVGGGSSVTFSHGENLGTASAEGISRNYDFRMPFQVMFKEALEVLPDEEYTLQAQLKIVRESTFGFAFGGTSTSHGGFGSYGNQIDAYYGTKSLSTVYVPCADGIKVNFTFPNSLGGEPFVSGQIPQIIFSV